MSTPPSETETQNLRFYENVYASKGWLVDKLLPYISYDQLSKNKRNIRHAIAHIRRPVGHTISVFDYGCGRGTFLHRIPLRPLKLYGLDISPGAIQSLTIRNWGSGREFSGVTEEAFRQGDYIEAFDLCCASHILEHVPDDKLVTSRLVQSLIPGGILVVNVPINEIFDDPNHVRTYDSDRIRALFTQEPTQTLDYIECDRFTSFIVHHERAASGNRIRGIFWRAVRAVLALLPLTAVEGLECLLPKRHANSQAIIVVRKTR